MSYEALVELPSNSSAASADSDSTSRSTSDQWTVSTFGLGLGLGSVEGRDGLVVVLRGSFSGVLHPEAIISSTRPTIARTLLPLNSGWWFGTDIIYYSIYSFYLIDNPATNGRKKIMWQITPLGRHTVNTINTT